MFLTAAVYVLLAYHAWTMLDTGVPGAVVTDLWVLLVVSSLVALGLIALALPVRRGGHVLWRAAQFGSVVALGVAVSALHMAARLADTPILVVGLVVAFFAIIVNIALWSTGVRRWCRP